MFEFGCGMGNRGSDMSSLKVLCVSSACLKNMWAGIHMGSLQSNGGLHHVNAARRR